MLLLGRWRSYMPSSRVIVCGKCGKEGKHSAKGMCSSCFRASFTCVCKRCGRDWVRGSKDTGLCRSCYDHDYYLRPEVKDRWPWARRLLRHKSEGKEALTIDFLTQLQSNTPNCSCCSMPLRYDLDKGQRRPKDQATLDKITPSLGYIPDNVAIICGDCNRKKDNSTAEDLKMILTYIERSNKVRVS